MLDVVSPDDELVDVFSPLDEDAYGSVFETATVPEGQSALSAVAIFTVDERIVIVGAHVYAALASARRSQALPVTPL